MGHCWPDRIALTLLKMFLFFGWISKPMSLLRANDCLTENIIIPQVFDLLSNIFRCFAVYGELLNGCISRQCSSNAYIYIIPPSCTFFLNPYLPGNLGIITFVLCSDHHLVGVLKC